MPRLAAALAVCLVLVAAPRVHAEPDDAVALLPLDADKNLEIYGQPVASEIARALVAGDVNVVVVGPKMAVPERARLIIDGTISSKGAAVILAVRVRNPTDGTTLFTLQSTAASLSSIDTAAAEVSAKVLPAVREKLAAFHKPAVVEPPHHDVVVQPPPPAPPTPMLVSVVATSSRGEPLRAILAAQVATWAAAHHREMIATTPEALTTKVADLKIAFDIARLTLDPGPVPMARARVRVRIANATGLLFDRVLVTDTVLGERNMAADALTARVAREVLDILRPHLRRVVAGWQ